MHRDIHDRVVIVVGLESIELSLTTAGSNPDRDFGFFHEEAIQLADRMFVVPLRCLVSEIMHEGTPEVFLECHHNL